MAYDNPSGIIAASVILQLISILCVALRFYTYRKKGVATSTTDWLILASVIGALGLTVMEIYGVAVRAFAYPLGSTIEDPKAVTGRLNKAKHIELSFLLLGIATLGLIKLSVTFLYWRIFSNKPIFKKVLLIWMTIIVAWTLSFVLAGLLECGSHLMALFGDPKEYLQSCGSAIPSGWAMVGSDIATDFITLIIPIPMIWSLRMSTSNKILVAGTFMIGSLSVGASIAKGYIYITATLGLNKDDAILTLTGLSLWNLIEVQIGIMAACGPTLRPVLSDLIPRASLISVLDSLKNHLSSGKGSSNESHHNSSYAKTISDENLVNGEYKGRTEISTDDLEMQPRAPGAIHVQKDVAYMS